MQLFNKPVRNGLTPQIHSNRRASWNSPSPRKDSDPPENRMIQMPSIRPYRLKPVAETGDRFCDFAPYVASINDRGLVAFQAALVDGGRQFRLERGLDEQCRSARDSALPGGRTAIRRSRRSDRMKQLPFPRSITLSCRRGLARGRDQQVDYPHDHRCGEHGGDDNQDARRIDAAQVL